MDQPLIQPPDRPSFPWGWLVAGVVAIMTLAAGHYWKHDVVDFVKDKAAIVRPASKNDVESRISELHQLIKTYRSMSIEIAGATGQKRANLLDDRSLVIGRINSLADTIPADRLPAEAHRFILAR